MQVQGRKSNSYLLFQCEFSGVLELSREQSATIDKSPESERTVENCLGESIRSNAARDVIGERAYHSY